MTSMKIFIDPRMITAKHADQLRLRFPQITLTADPREGEDADAIFCHPAYAIKENLDRYPSLAWVQIMMAGFNTADLRELRRRGIAVTNMKDIFHLAVAEDVFTKILAINRNVRHYYEMMPLGRWEPIRHEPEIYGSTIGILGAGSIGSAVALRMKAFGARTIGWRRKNAPSGGFDEIVTGRDGLDNLLTESDYIVITLPLSEETDRLIGAREIGMMKTNAVLINVGRGEIIDQNALVEALRLGRIRGAGLDVTTPEPLPPDHPLWHLPGVYITPHNASSSPFVWPRIVTVLEQNIELYLAGQPLINRVED
ncbi:MAG: D-2-hydroxyacid dehydrogenase [bacterium]